jgi:hypothetical protein
MITLPMVGRAQQPSTAGVAEPDLATRYHFIERYTNNDKPAPDTIGQYRVALRETIKFMTEQPQGAPIREENTVDTLYTERPALVNAGGAVRALIRRYDPPLNPRSAPSALAGLTLWYQIRDGGAPPEILTLTEGRPLLEHEYGMATRQIFLPNLGALLPTLPQRLNDHWQITPAAARVLLNEPFSRGELPSATLHEVRRMAKGSDWEAVITIQGHAGQTALAGRLVFRFPPPAPLDPDDAKSRDADAPIEAKGAIVSLRLGTRTNVPQPGGNGRLQKTIERSLILARRLRSDEPLLTIPDITPLPDETNSWLTYVDPDKKFHFRIPQELRRDDADSFRVAFGEDKLGKRSTVVFQFMQRTGDPEVDRMNRDPEFQLKSLKEEWRQNHVDVRLGHPGYLSDADWAAVKMKVYRVDAIVMAKTPDMRRTIRVYEDRYFIQFGSDDALLVTATTEQDSPASFRKRVEAIIKTFRFGPPATAKSSATSLR